MRPISLLGNRDRASQMMAGEASCHTSDSDTGDLGTANLDTGGSDAGDW